MIDQYDIEVNTETVPDVVSTVHRSGYRTRNRKANAPDMPGWNVSALGTTGFMVSGKPDNVDHRPIALRDVVVAMRERYDNNERRLEPSRAPIDVDAMMQILKLFYRVVIDALVNGQRVHIDGFGTFVPVFMPYYVKTDLEGFEDIGDGKRKPVFSKHIEDHWGSVVFIPKLPHRFYSALGDMYLKKLPAHGRSLLMERTKRRRGNIKRLVDSQIDKGKEYRHAKRKRSAFAHNGYRSEKD